ncbi:hypothetical protein VKT23_008433 [Stygiomarasmius scandens]|uniref:Uncharacterized protein n=1 Tax=Marasmiellus scandens TaxID=2682957 RepID=A0ABR1JGD9_9AGAR
MSFSQHDLRLDLVGKEERAWLLESGIPEAELDIYVRTRKRIRARKRKQQRNKEYYERNKEEILAKASARRQM